jgi:hypothetical protein
MILLCLLSGMILSCVSADTVHAADYIIREIISVHPGDQLTRDLVVYKKFNLTTLSGVEGFIVYTWGYIVPAGDMGIKLVCLADNADSQRIGFSLIVGGYSLKQMPVARWKLAFSPDTIEQAIPVNSTFGIYYIGVLVNRIVGDVDLPIPFAITFSVSEGSTQ